MLIHKSQTVPMVYKIYKENLQGQYKFRKLKNENNLGPLMFLAALKLWESLIYPSIFVSSVFFLFFSLAHNEPTLRIPFGNCWGKKTRPVLNSTWYAEVSNRYGLFKKNQVWVSGHKISFLICYFGDSMVF